MFLLLHQIPPARNALACEAGGEESDEKQFAFGGLRKIDGRGKTALQRRVNFAKMMDDRTYLPFVPLPSSLILRQFEERFG